MADDISKAKLILPGKKKKKQGMLLLTRRPGEAIKVGDEVSVTVLGTKGNQVRLGIEAPKEIEVHREEVYERIHPDDEG